MAGKKRDGGSVKVKITDGGSLKDLGKNAKNAGKQVGSVAKNVQESDRRLKSLSQQTSNSSKAFSKQAQTIGGGLVPIYATIAAQVFAVTAAFRALQDAMETRNMIEGQKAFGAVTGNAFATMTQSVQQATANMITFKEAASAVAIGSAAGLTRTQLEGLGTAAKNASLALGRDVTDAFNRLIRGVTKAEPELLDELGIILRLEPATQKYALAIGKSREELTAFERSQAVANEVLTQAETKFGRITEIMDENAFVLGQFSKEFDDLTKVMKVGIAEFLIPVIGYLKENITSLIGVFGLLVAPIITQLMPNFSGLADRMSDISKASKDMAKNLKKDAKMISNLQKDGSLTAEGRKQFSASGRSGMQGMLSGMDMSGQSKTMQKAAMGKKLNAQELGVLKRHLKQKGHILNQFNAQEKAKFNRYIKHQELSLKGSLTKAKLEYKSLGITTSATFAKIQATATSAFSAIARGAAFAGRAVAGLASAFGWISLAFVAFDALRNMFKEAEKEMTKAEKRSQEFGETLKTLKDELDKMAQVQAEGFVVGGVARLEQQANSLKTGDILGIMQAFNKELSEGTMTEDRQKQLIGVAKGLERITPALKDVDGMALSDLFSGDIDNLKKIDMTDNAFVKIANDIMGAGLALSQFTSQMEGLNKQRFNVVSGAKKRRFASLRGELRGVLGDGGSLGLNTIEQMQRAQDDSAASTAEFGRSLEGIANLTKPMQQEGYLARFGITEEELGTGFDYSRYVKLKQEQGKRFEELAKSETGRTILQQALGTDFLDTEETALKALHDSLYSGSYTHNKTGEKMFRVNPEGASHSTKGFRKFDVAAGKIVQRLNREEIADMQKKYAEQLKQEGLSQDEIDRRLKLRKENLAFQSAIDKENENIIASEKKKHEIAKAALDISVMADKQSQMISRGKLETEKKIKAIEDANIEQRIAQTMLDELGSDAKQEDKQALEDQLDLAKRNTAEAEKQLEIQKALLGLKYDQFRNDTDRMEERFSDGSFFNSFRNKKQDFMNSDMAVQRLSEATTEEGRANIIEELNKEYDARQKITAELKLQNQISTRLTEGIANDMAGALIDVAKGTKTFKEAFGQMAISVIADITKMIIKQLILNALMAMVGMVNPGAAASLASLSGSGLPTGRVGGIMTPGAGDGYRSYRSGGVADGPDSGYQATLHGTEAVVPLGNDREIPVKMLNGGGGNVTANVTVNMSDGGSSVDVQTEGEKAKAFANGISAAVQQEIVKQQRAGGLLSSY